MASNQPDWETEKPPRISRAMDAVSDLKAVYCSNDAMALGFFSKCKKKMLFAVVGFDNDAVMKNFFLQENWLLQLTFSVHKWLSEGLRFALDVLEGRIENRGVHSTAYEIIKQ